MHANTFVSFSESKVEWISSKQIGVRWHACRRRPRPSIRRLARLRLSAR